MEVAAELPEQLLSLPPAEREPVHPDNRGQALLVALVERETQFRPVPQGEHLALVERGEAEVRLVLLGKLEVRLVLSP
jgi:hypothetical protein